MNVVDLHGVTQARTSPHDRALAAQLLSDRHREWGYDCSAVNLDFVPYDDGRPVGLVEYKHEYAASFVVADQAARIRRPFGVLKTLADMAGLPLLVCRHADDFSWWRAQAVNERARVFLPHRAEFDENAWVHLLYGLSGRVSVPRRTQRFLNGQPRLEL